MVGSTDVVEVNVGGDVAGDVGGDVEVGEELRE